MAGSYWIPCKLLTHYRTGEYKIKYEDPITGETVKEIVKAENIKLPKMPK
jgi:hypothetical protein